MSSLFSERIPVEFFAPGRYHIGGKRENFTPTRIAAMVAKTKSNAAQFAGLSQIPFKAGHTGDPNAQIGYLDVSTLSVTADGRAVGDVVITEPDAVEKVKRGTWKFVSAELYLGDVIDEQTGQSLGEAFRGLAVVPHPRVKNIRGLNPDTTVASVFAEGRFVETETPMYVDPRAFFGDATPTAMDEQTESANITRNVHALFTEMNPGAGRQLAETERLIASGGADEVAQGARRMFLERWGADALKAGIRPSF